MTLSTSTRRNVTENILRNIGERSLPETSPTMVKAADAIRSAVAQMSVDNEWLALREYVAADSWVGGVATLPPHAKLYDVEYQAPGVPAIQLQWLPVIEERQLIATDLVTTSVPLYYTILTDLTVRVHPVPTEPDYVLFYLLRHFVFPITLDTVFNMPEGLIPLLTLKATALLALSHLGDERLALAYETQYQAFLQRLRSFYRGQPSERNMFRRHVNYGSWNFRRF